MELSLVALTKDVMDGTYLYLEGIELASAYQTSSYQPWFPKPTDVKVRITNFPSRAKTSAADPWRNKKSRTGNRNSSIALRFSNTN